MATLSFSGFCRLALPLVAAILLITPAMARHHYHHRPHKGHSPPASQSAASAPETPAAAPIPEPRPAEIPDRGSELEPLTPAVAPTPPEKPTEVAPEPPATAPTPPQKPAQENQQKTLPDPRSAELPADRMPEDEVACSIPYPIVLKTLGKSIGIASGTELNCRMAEAAARFAVDVIQPAAKAEFGADLKSITQASAFVCRPRYGGGKLSEHAFGNALDIASFTLSDGRTIEIGPVPPEKDAKFLDTVRKAACGPFKTVLGPGADPGHALHFHFDLEPRRHGGTFCQ